MAFTFSNRNQSILERRFITQVLQEEGKNIIDEQNRIDLKFDFKATGKGRSFHVNENELVLEHNIIQRFRDMNRIKGRKQVSTRQHNRVIFGHFNNIIGSLRFGFTDAIQKELSQEYKIEING